MANEKGVWRTIGGRRVFIKEGQDLASAMKESGKFKPASKISKKDEDSIKESMQKVAKQYEEDKKNGKVAERLKEIEDYERKTRIKDKKIEKVLEDFKDSDGSKEKFEKALNKISEMEYNNEINPDEYKESISKIQKEYVEKNKKTNNDYKSENFSNKEDNKGEYKMYDKFEYKDGQLTAYDSYGKEVDSYGLSKEDYEENPKYWQDKFKEETNREAMNEINSSDIKLANELRKETEKKYNSLKEKQKNGYGISKEDLEDFVNNSNYQKRDELINSDKEFKKQIDGALENYNMNIKDMDRKAFENAMGYNKEKTRNTSGRQEIKNASPSQIEKGDLIGPKHLLVTAIRPASVEKDGYSSGYSVTTKDSNGNTSRQIISDSARNTIYKKQTTNQLMNDTLRNAFDDYKKKHKNSNMSFTEFMRINKK